MKERGFTLIEILVALGVFAIIASMTSYVLFQSFHTDKQLKAQSMHLHTLGLALTLFRRDTEQLINRPVRGEQQQLRPPFIGRADYLEFTRTGAINLGAVEQRSTLRRVAYLCRSNKLIRRSWPLLDSPDRRDFHDTVLLPHLKHCSFSYTNAKHESLPTWTIDLKDNKHPGPLLPMNINCHLDLESWGQISVAFIIPVGLYD